MDLQSTPISSELPQNRRRYGRFWLIFSIVMVVWAVGTAVYLVLLWPWMRTWGATKAEINAALDQKAKTAAPQPQAQQAQQQATAASNGSQAQQIEY